MEIIRDEGEKNQRFTVLNRRAIIKHNEKTPGQNATCCPGAPMNLFPGGLFHGFQTYAAVGTARSVIRELFEYGNQRAKEVGRENVFDFSLGNPSVPAPDAVNENAIRILQEQPGSDPLLHQCSG